MSKPNAFRQFFESQTDEELEAIAKAAGTSVAYLYQIARGNRKGGAHLIDRLMDAGRRDVVMHLRPNWFSDEERQSA